jgi:cyclic-di-AMP phosphodiesterase PgpH
VISEARNRPRISPLLCAGFALTQALLLVLVLFPLLPGRLQVKVGDIASQTITAPRNFSYNSEVVRQRLQDEAARSVKDVIVYDGNIDKAQLSVLQELLSTVAGARVAGSLPPRRLGDGTQSGTVNLTPELQQALFEMPNDRYQYVSDEARRVLNDVLQEPFSAAELDAKRASVTARIGPGLDPTERQVVVALVQPLVQPTERVDSAATELQRQRAVTAIPPQVRRFAVNQDIVRQGEPIDASDLEALRAAGLTDTRIPIADLLAVALIAGSASLALSAYLYVFQPRALNRYLRLVLLALVIALIVLVARVCFPLIFSLPRLQFLAFAVPAALAPMLVAALFEVQLAVVVAAVVAVLTGFAAIYVPQLSGYVGLTALQLFQLVLAFLLSGLAGVFSLRGVVRLSRYLVAGAAVAGAGFVAIVGVWALDPSRRPLDLVWIAIACLASGTLAALLSVGVVALLGPLFGITTRLQLMELAQLNAPLLRQLQEEAPGTFHHSVMVGNLAERAADLIGADALLVRVGCYYHDIGKISRPAFFIENQLSGESPHGALQPAASAGIISEHVRYGEELARRHGLPEAVSAFISEHHGTRLVSYFYRKAAQTDPDVDTSAFAYAGPRPRSRETGIVMLADSTEAAARAATDRSQEQLDAIVDSVFNERIAEGQLDDSELTLRDLRTVAASFKSTLRAIYHPRIEYPAPTPIEEARRERVVVGNPLDGMS